VQGSLVAVCPRRRPVRTIVLGAFAALAASAALSGVLASGATAAGGVRACFTFRGAPVGNLTTTLEKRMTDGSFTYLGAPYRTDRYGCVTYSIHGWWQNRRVRVHAVGFVANTRYVLIANSYYYSGFGRGFYRLGTGFLRLYVLPAQTTPTPAQNSGSWDPGDWVGQMGGSPNNSAFCNQSPAMQVACYMDRHNMHGNVVSLDLDHDGHLAGVNDVDDSDPNRW
jgi:hypothetical protein